MLACGTSGTHVPLFSCPCNIQYGFLRIVSVVTRKLAQLTAIDRVGHLWLWLRENNWQGQQKKKSVTSDTWCQLPALGLRFLSAVRHFNVCSHYLITGMMSLARWTGENDCCVALISQWHDILCEINWTADCLTTPYQMRPLFSLERYSLLVNSKGCGEDTIMAKPIWWNSPFTKSGWGKSRKISDRRTGVLAEIWNDLLNTRSVTVWASLSVERSHNGNSLKEWLLWSANFKAVKLHV
jgi:hypothetical protein